MTWDQKKDGPDAAETLKRLAQTADFLAEHRKPRPSKRKGWGKRAHLRAHAARVRRTTLRAYAEEQKRAAARERAA